MSKIDKKIAEIKQKEQSAENLNHLGDLYLEKGEKLTAVSYYYSAAASSSRDKAIAIYKKVLSILPSEVLALQSLIDIYASTGWIAKAVEYLLQLANHYRGRGEGQEEIKVYRRILELDPENESAVNYFGRGKGLAAKISRMEETKVHKPLPPGPVEEAARLSAAPSGE
ncbi:MAG TPA: hypothetical protein VN328_05720, partial [Thermodesulfovibrionales bacterium]|nr:hypothetical protein [Thermodesulfovibrionales bacterium]